MGSHIAISYLPITAAIQARTKSSLNGLNLYTTNKIIQDLGIEQLVHDLALMHVYDIEVGGC